MVLNIALNSYCKHDYPFICLKDTVFNELCIVIFVHFPVMVWLSFSVGQLQLFSFSFHLSFAMSVALFAMQKKFFLIRKDLNVLLF